MCGLVVFLVGIWSGSCSEINCSEITAAQKKYFQVAPNNVFKLLRKKNKYQGTLTSKKMKKSRHGGQRLVKDPERYKTVLCSSWRATGTCAYGLKCQFAHGKEELRFRQMNGVQQLATQPIWPPLPDGPPPSTCLMLPTPYALLQPSIPFGPPDPIDPHAVRAAQAVARAFSCRQIAPSVPPPPPGPPPPLSPKTPPGSVGEPGTVPRSVPTVSPSAVGLPHSSSSVSEDAKLQEFEDLLLSSAMYLSDVSTLSESLEPHVR